MTQQFGNHSGTILVNNLLIRVVLLSLLNLVVAVIVNVWQAGLQTGKSPVFRVKRAVTSNFLYLLLVVSLLGVNTHHSVVFFAVRNFLKIFCLASFPYAADTVNLNQILVINFGQRRKIFQRLKNISFGKGGLTDYLR